MISDIYLVCSVSSDRGLSLFFTISCHVAQVSLVWAVFERINKLATNSSQATISNKKNANNLINVPGGFS
jgi:hypothetical protein